MRVYDVNVVDKVITFSKDGEVIIDKHGKELLADTLEFMKKNPPPEKLK